MYDHIPDYAFHRTKVIHKVRDTSAQTTNEVTEDEVADARPSRVTFDVTVENAVDDPMVAVMLLAHLRSILGGPDIERVSVEVEYDFSGLSRAQLATLYALRDMSWSGLHIEVTEERRTYDRAGGTPPLRHDEAA